ncbi:MAG: glycosyltransferase [Spirochaetaceae bacterium]
MKIAIFTDTFYPQVNGIVTSIIDIAKGMADKGHKVFIISPDESISFVEFVYKDIEVLRIPAVDAAFYEGFKWSTIIHKPTYKRLKKENIDLVHFMTPITISVFGILVGKRLGKPIIGTYHTFVSELTYLRQFFPRAGSFTQRFAWWFTNSFYNRSHLITTPTENARKELIRNKARIEVEAVSNGIKLDSFDNSKADLIKQKYNPDGELALYVGRIAPEKNMICLLTSFKKLCEKDLTTILLVVGGGPSFAECKEFVKSQGLDKRIIFLGQIPTDELKTSGIFGACKLFVTASTTETQSITILEAEANGIPCIGPDAKGIPCVIENNHNGFLVTPNDSEEITDAMEKLLTDEELYKKFSANCLESVKKQDFNLILDQWEDRYHRVMNMPRRHKKISRRDVWSRRKDY